MNLVIGRIQRWVFLRSEAEDQSGETKSVGSTL